jgi:hypothetical protein
MSDPAELNDRLLQAVLKAEPASQIMFDVANGDDQTEVQTLSGLIPSLAKWLKDKGNALVDSAAALQDYAALRAYTGPLSIVRILKPGITGFFQHRAGDTTSADNNGTSSMPRGAGGGDSTRARSTPPGSASSAASASTRPVPS